MKKWTYEQAVKLDVFTDGEQYVVISSKGDAMVVAACQDFDNIWSFVYFPGQEYTPSKDDTMIPVSSLI